MCMLINEIHLYESVQCAYSIEILLLDDKNDYYRIILRLYYYSKKQIQIISTNRKTIIYSSSTFLNAELPWIDLIPRTFTCRWRPGVRSH